MSDRSILVVVDMQPHFFASQQKQVMDNVVGLVREAKRKRNPVILVEYYEDYWKTPTDKRITDRLEGYKRLEVVKKNQCDGGKKVAKAIRKRNWNPSLIKVCGVQTSACVQQTVETMLVELKDSQIVVVKDACNDIYDYGDEPDFFKYYPIHKRLKLV